MSWRLVTASRCCQAEAAAANLQLLQLWSALLCTALSTVAGFVVVIIVDTCAGFSGREDDMMA